MLQATTHVSINSLPGPPGRLRSTWKLMTRPYETYGDWSRRYGKSFRVKALNGTVLATSNTENIRRILAARHDEVSQFAIGTISPLIGEHSVLIVAGERHKRARSLLAPPFRGEALRNSMQTMQAIADRVAANWKPGSSIRVMDTSLEYSLDVIIEVVFGVQDPDRVQQFKSAIKSYVGGFRPIFAFTKLFQKRWVPAWNRFLKERERFDALLDLQIAGQRERQHEGFNIISMLLKSRDEDGNPLGESELRDHLITLLFAGHETTQIAIAWAMSWLHRNPPILKRFREELNSTDSLEEMLSSDLLDGICHEALRLNPIVADFLRVFQKPIELEEITLPAGSSAAILSCVVHQDPDIYPEPEKFNPDRWLTHPARPNEFLAFGGGIRRCIGATMALMEMKIALVTWLRRFEFALPPNAPPIEPVHRRNLTMAPKSGIELMVIKEIS